MLKVIVSKHAFSEDMFFVSVVKDEEMVFTAPAYSGDNNGNQVLNRANREAKQLAFLVGAEFIPCEAK